MKILPLLASAFLLSAPFAQAQEMSSPNTEKAISLIQSGRIEEAVPLLQAECDKNVPRAWNAAGILFVQSGQVEKGVGCYARSLDLGYIPAAENLASLLTGIVATAKCAGIGQDDPTLSQLGAKAVDFAKLAVENGIDRTRAYLAILYWCGYDTGITKEQACEYLKAPGAAPENAPLRNYLLYRSLIQKAGQNGTEVPVQQAMQLLPLREELSAEGGASPYTIPEIINWSLFGPDSGALSKSLIGRLGPNDYLGRGADATLPYILAPSSTYLFFHKPSTGSSGDGDFMAHLAQSLESVGKVYAFLLGGDSSSLSMPSPADFHSMVERTWKDQCASKGLTLEQVCQSARETAEKSSANVQADSRGLSMKASFPQPTRTAGDALTVYTRMIACDDSMQLAHADACFHGFGTKCDAKHALELTEAVVESGNRARAGELAEAYFWGVEVKQDLAKARQYAKGTGTAIETALAKGKKPGDYKLKKDASAHLKTLAKSLKTEAGRQEFLMYLSGYLHTKKAETDMEYRCTLLETALSCMEKAGVSPEPVLSRLHRVYLYGGVKDNLKRFATFAEKRAKAGDPRYVEVAAIGHLRGVFGFPHDKAKAQKWTEWLVANKDKAGYLHWIPMAYICCAFSDKPEYTKAHAYLTQFEDKGAYYVLSFLYLYGWGVTPDGAKSRDYLEKAADGTNSDADLLLQREKSVRW